VKIKIRIIVILPVLCGWEDRSLKWNLLSVGQFVVYFRTLPAPLSAAVMVQIQKWISINWKGF
jgi:hypothetical protein